MNGTLLGYRHNNYFESLKTSKQNQLKTKFYFNS